MLNKSDDKKIHEEKKALVELKGEHYLKRHEMRMEELRFIRESENINHDNSMTRQRIKSAEIRKAQERRHH